MKLWTVLLHLVQLVLLCRRKKANVSKHLICLHLKLLQENLNYMANYVNVILKFQMSWLWDDKHHLVDNLNKDRDNLLNNNNRDNHVELDRVTITFVLPIVLQIKLINNITVKNLTLPGWGKTLFLHCKKSYSPRLGE